MSIINVMMEHDIFLFFFYNFNIIQLQLCSNVLLTENLIYVQKTKNDRHFITA